MEDSSRPRVTLAELLELLIDRIALEEIRVALPATVIKFIPGGAESEYGTLPAMVEVEIDLKSARRGFAEDAEEDETFKEVAGSLSTEGELISNYPTITCPVFYPGPANMWIRGELLAGEQGLIIWTDRELGRWLVAARGSESTVDPKWSLSHGANLSSGFFLPGLVNGPTWPVDVPGEGARIGPRDGSAGMLIDSAGVTIDGIEVKLGDGASTALALVSDFITPFGAFETAINAIPGAGYPAEWPAIKAACVALATAMKALAGSLKGRG